MHGGLTDTTWREKLPPICPGCGYNLTGVESGRCPECGRGVIWTELRVNARTVYYALRQVEEVNDVLAFGVYLGAGALLVLLAFYALNCWVIFVRVVSFFMALATAGTGLQVLRVRRFPEWASELLPQRPNYAKAVGLVFLAVITIVLAIFLPAR